MMWKGTYQEELIPESTRRPPSEVQKKRTPGPETRTEKSKKIHKSQSKITITSLGMVKLGIHLG